MHVEDYGLGSVEWDMASKWLPQDNLMEQMLRDARRPIGNRRCKSTKSAIRKMPFPKHRVHV